jgi:soluble lytic murein transglycosylase
MTTGLGPAPPLMRRAAAVRGAVFVAAVAALTCCPVAGSIASVRLSHSDQRIYRQAFDELAAGRLETALRLAQRGSNALLTKVLEWNDMVRGAPGVSFQEIQQFRADNPHWPRQDALRVQAEIRLPSSLSNEAVLDFMGDGPPATVNGVIRLAQALLALGRDKEAMTLIRRTWIEENLTESEEKTFRAQFGERLTERDDKLRLDRLLWDGRLADARRMIPRVPKSHQMLAKARILLRTRAPGVDAALLRVPKRLQNDPGLLFERALWRMRKGRYEDTLEILNAVPASAARPDKWWDLRNWAARIALGRNDYALAYRLAARNGLSAGREFAEAEWLAGWVALRFLKSPATALKHFSTLYDGVTTPISRARGAYWAGRADEALGEEATADAWYRKASQHPATFYGQLAEEKLKEEPRHAFVTVPPPPLNDRLAFEQRELVRTVRLLAALGRPQLAEPFLKALADQAKNPGNYYLVADLAADVGLRDTALRIAKEALYSDGHVLPHLYPMAVAGVAEAQDPALVLAVIRQESAFRVGASSRAGALGLMQLMPATAREVAEKESVIYRKRRLTRDPYYNVRLGRAYLSHMIDYFDGSYVLAIASYNAGPGRARQWVEAWGDPRDPNVNVIDWIERIPFDETRNYVQRVLENLTMYRRILGSIEPAERSLGQILKQQAMAPSLDQEED